MNISWCFDDLSSPLGRAYASDLSAYLIGRSYIERGGVGLSLRELAAHEAGHTTVMYLLGCRLMSAEIFEKVGGVVRLAEDDELRAGWGFFNLPMLAKSMQVLASGYVGERLLHAPMTFSSGHELGLMLYQAQIIGLHHGITATAAVRATFNECERVLVKHKGVAMEIANQLMSRGQLNAQEITAMFSGVELVGEDDWLALAKAGGGQPHPEIEQMLRFASLVADAGWRTYAEIFPDATGESKF